jgi:hypothetical protein
MGQQGQSLGAGNFHLLKSRAALAGGSVSRALRESRQALRRGDELGMPLGRAVCRLSLAEAQLAAGHPEQALTTLAEAEHDVAAVGPLVEQGSLLLQAAIAGTGDTRRADELVERAFASGSRWGFMPVAWPAPITRAALCERAIQRGIESDYARRVLGKLGQTPGHAAGRLLAEVGEAEGVEPSRPTTEPASPQPAERPAPYSAPGVPGEFSKAVRQALRCLHETHRLSLCTLLDATLVTRRAGTQAAASHRIDALRQLLREGVEALRHSARTESAYRALFHTYLDPAPTQLLAAQAAHMPFGSYRRHLSAGIEELSATLWLREQAIHSEPATGLGSSV